MSMAARSSSHVKHFTLCACPTSAPSRESSVLQDLRFAVRTLIKNPAFTLAAVLCLALGIGVNATIFSCVRALLLRPFPYRNPDELVALGESSPKRGWHMNTVSYPNFRSW